MANLNVKVSIPVTREWNDSTRGEFCSLAQDCEVTVNEGKVTIKWGTGVGELTFERADLEAALNFLKPPKPPGPTFR